MSSDANSRPTATLSKNPAILAALARLKQASATAAIAPAQKPSETMRTLLEAATPTAAPSVSPVAVSVPQTTQTTQTTGHPKILFNERQLQFIETASRESCVLIGAAGTGKTTATKGLIEKLSCDVSRPRLAALGHKHLTDGTPGIVCCAFTRRATNNIRRVMPADMKNNCVSIHKLLEFQPEYYEDWDEEGNFKTKMRFAPSRTRGNPLPVTIHTLIIDESSMVGTDLYDLLLDAISHQMNIIFLGDIQQLPPVFGPAILGYKLLSLPVIELVEVYRQAMDSPIIRLAHTILRGEALPLDKKSGANQATNIEPYLTLHPWKKTLTEDGYCMMAAAFFKQAFGSGRYDPEEDIILIPYNKSFGTIEINKHIATFMARFRKVPVHEVICGFNKKYFAVGDKVMYEKEDATILTISKNMKYLGKAPAKPSETMDYWGHGAQAEDGPGLSHEQIDAMLGSYAVDDERTTAASHVITLLVGGEYEVSLDSAGALNALEHGYAITVHKAQGSEWRRVFFISSEIHNRMLSRELVYTAVTRAREELYVICNPNLFERIVTAQVIKGNTLAEKAQYFQGRYVEGN